MSGIVGRTYLERGQPVVVLIQWRTGHGPGGPKNVKIRRTDGTETVRPFRGLRRPPDDTDKETSMTTRAISAWTCSSCGQRVQLADARWHYDKCAGGDRAETVADDDNDLDDDDPDTAA